MARIGCHKEVCLAKYGWNGRVPFFLCEQTAHSLNGSLMVHDVTLLAPSCLPGLSSSQLLTVLAGAKMRLQMTSRSHGGWLRAVWSSGVTVTAPQNEERSACLCRLLTAPPTLSQRAAQAPDTFLSRHIYLRVSKSEFD